MPSHPPASPAFPWSKLAVGAVVLFTLVLFDQRVRFTAGHTANIFFSDQWDIYNPLFNGEGWWKIFSYQHGPHRQGVGFLFTAALAHFTQWDARGDALLTVAVSGLAALLALPLARRCGARGGFTLVTVPVIFLTMRQFESWIGPANPSHGAVPVLLMLLYGLTWFVPRPRWRLGLLVLLTLFLVFTGFGLFAGALSPVLIGLEAWHAWRRSDRPAAVLAGAAALLCLAIWGLFFTGYQQQPAVPNFHFPHDRPLEYIYFSGLMLASYAGWQGRLALDVTGGILLFLALGAVAVVHGLRLLRASPETRPASTAIFLLSASTLLYCLNTAVGRVMLGWSAAPYAPRYVTLVVPGVFALFLHGETLTNRRWRNGWWVALLLLAGTGGLFLHQQDRKAVEWYAKNREQWREVYLATGSQQKANEATSPDQGYMIHPGDLTAKLEYLRIRRLNLFKPDPFTP